MPLTQKQLNDIQIHHGIAKASLTHSHEIGASAASYTHYFRPHGGTNGRIIPSDAFKQIHNAPAHLIGGGTSQ